MPRQATLRDRVQGWALRTYAGWVQRTARLQIKGLEHMVQARATGRPVILAAWHGMTMMFSVYLVNHDDPSLYTLIVPDDSRGATLSEWVKKLGSTPFVVSMNDASMGSGRRLLQLIRELRQGKHLYLNPDGPEGLTHEAKKGVAYVALKSGALVVPGAAYTSTCYRIPRWDRYTIPLPYSRIAIYLGAPLETVGDPEEMRRSIQEGLNKSEKAAQSLYEGD